MLEKDSGGFRLIGVYPAVVRVWAKARSDIVSAWESERLDAPYFSAQHGSGAEDVAWHISARMEASACDKEWSGSGPVHDEVVIAGTWDLQKYYETISHATIMTQARRHGMCPAILQ